jgi:hypothetical protein
MAIFYVTLTQKGFQIITDPIVIIIGAVIKNHVGQVAIAFCGESQKKSIFIKRFFWTCQTIMLREVSQAVDSKGIQPIMA